MGDLGGVLMYQFAMVALQEVCLYYASVYLRRVCRDLLLCDRVRACVYVGGVVDVVECGLFFSLGVCGWTVSLCNGRVGCCALCPTCDA